MQKLLRKHNWLLLLTILAISILGVQFAKAEQADFGDVSLIKSTLTTETLTGSVARREVDYFALDAEPGLMSVSVSWGNSYDIDVYICSSANYNDYLARGYTTNNPESCSYTIQTAGTYYIAVRMYSYWASSTAYTAEVSYYTGGGGDTENPVVSITSPSNGATVSDTISITASASDNVGVDYVQYNVDSGSWTQDTTSPYSWSLDTTTLTDGSHTINVQAFDAAGNYATDSISINVDNSGGSVPIHQDFEGAVAGSEVDYYEILAQPGLMEVSVSWVGSNDIDCYIMTSPDYTSYLARGYTTSNPETCSYTIQTAGTYYVGVRMYTSSASSTAYTCSVDYYGSGSGDYTKPTVSITAPTNGATVQDTITISATASDDVAIDYLAYQIDGGSWTTDSTSPYSWSWDTTTVGDGSHTITVRAYDTSGNYQDDSVTVSVDNVVDPTGNYPWWNDAIDAEKVHANGVTGAGTVVVIIDTGFGANYVDLFPSENILTAYCKSQTKELGYDSVDWNQDTEGHGTACTATVIGYWLDLSDGTHDYVEGVAPDAKIVMIRTVYWVGGSVTETSMLNAWADAINYAVDLSNGALSSYNMIISMSLGYSGTNTNLNNAVANAENQGVVIATSAGNDGHTSTTTGYPATLDDTTSVAAAGWSTHTGSYGIAGLYTDLPEDDFSNLVIADFSSGGKVDVTGIGQQMILPKTDGYYYMSGTSFSCPQTAGVYALMFEAHGTQTVQWLENQITSTAYWGSGMTSFVWGSGFVQADAACGF